MTEGRPTERPVLDDVAALGPLFEHNHLPMWVQDGDGLRLLAANAAARHAYGWDDTSLDAAGPDDIRPHGIVTAQEFARPDGGSVWVVTELDGLSRGSRDDEHDRLLTELVAVQEQVRSNIAERLHDGPVQTLTAVSLRLGLLRRAVDPALEPKLAEAERLVVDSLASLRAEMNAHRSHGDVAGDLQGAISSTLRWLDLDEHVVVACSGAEPTGTVAALLYRVTQDLLASGGAAIRETATAPATIRVDVGDDEARLSVPVGPDVELVPRLVTWLSAMGGSVRHDGTVVVVTVPVPR